LPQDSTGFENGEIIIENQEVVPISFAVGFIDGKGYHKKNRSVFIRTVDIYGFCIEIYCLPTGITPRGSRKVLL